MDFSVSAYRSPSFIGSLQVRSIFSWVASNPLLQCLYYSTFPCKSQAFLRKNFDFFSSGDQWVLTAWIGSYGGRSWTFRCLPTAAPHLSAPSKLGAYSIVFITGPPFSIYIITHGRRKVKGFCEKILIFLGSVPSILCEVALLPDALRGIVPTIYIAGDGTPSD